MFILDGEGLLESWYRNSLGISQSTVVLFPSLRAGQSKHNPKPNASYDNLLHPYEVQENENRTRKYKSTGLASEVLLCSPWVTVELGG